MTFLKIDFASKEKIIASCDRIADTITKDVQLQINNAFYRIVDFEFYLYSKCFEDCFTHKDPEQLTNGKLYAHPSGIDITIGDGVNYGGILLRSVIRLHNGSDHTSSFMHKQTVGPWKVSTELFSNLNSITDGKPNIIALHEIDNHMDVQFYPAKGYIKSNRINLALKENDTNNYYRDIQLRYIAMLDNYHVKFDKAEEIVKAKLLSGDLTSEQAFDILNYRIKV